MNKKKWTIYGVIAAALVVASFAVPALADAPSYEQLQARLDRAEARIAQLDSREPTWLETRRSEEVRALVQDVLQDADSRTMLQGNGSPVTVNVHGFVQSRYTYSGGGNDEANHGFSVPRARLIFTGDIYDFSYKVSGQWSDGGEFTLKDAYADYSGFRVGQFKSPFMREVLVAQTDTLMTDRSIVSNQFGQGRSQGVQYGHDFGRMNFKVAYTDGFDTANGAGVQNGQAFTGRASVDVADWWNVGAAVSWNDMVDMSYTTYTVDTKVSMGGLDMTAAYVATTGDAGDNWGATVQAGYMCMDNFQGFVAYEYGELEGVSDNLSVFTVGANVFMNDNVKWTTDFGYALNGINGAWDLGETGWRAGDSGEYIVRTQLQFKF